MNKFEIGENVWTVSEDHIVSAEIRAIHFSVKRGNKYRLFVPSLETTLTQIPETDLAGSYKEAKKVYRKRYRNKTFFNQVVNLFL